MIVSADQNTIQIKFAALDFLALVSEIVQLLGGEVGVKSELNRGSVFTVILPVMQEKRGMEIMEFGGEKSLPVADKPVERKLPLPQKPLVLIIEDHPDMQQYLVECLGDRYRTEEALNGEQGIEKATDLQPDIIICDVMMPGKSGVEVCHVLKNHERTRHIPVIILTAKADLLTEQEGIRSGADLYLGKPFEEASLLLWIENHLERRKRLQEVFSSSDWVAKSMAQKEGIMGPDRPFLEKVLQIIQTRLHQPDFSVSELAASVNVGDRSFRRNFRALTGQSVKAYILDLRIQTAKELLRTSDLTIEQIATEVGYRSLAAFSRSFKKKLGMSPNKYREREQ